MPVAKHWTLDIYLSEEIGEGTAVTHAEARLRTQDATDLRGHGDAHRHPDDADVPEIGDELATARALSDLAQQLLRAAAQNVEAVTRQPVVRLTG
jgi:hypothetical protein